MSESSVQQQLDYLATAIGKNEASMIDPVSFGELKGQVQSLAQRLTHFETRQASMDAKIDMVLAKLSEAKGGWRLLMAMGGAAAVAGSVLTWFLSHTVTIK